MGKISNNFIRKIDFVQDPPRLCQKACWTQAGSKIYLVVWSCRVKNEFDVWKITTGKSTCGEKSVLVFI